MCKSNEFELKQLQVDDGRRSVLLGDENPQGYCFVAGNDGGMWQPRIDAYYRGSNDWRIVIRYRGFSREDWGFPGGGYISDGSELMF